MATQNLPITDEWGLIATGPANVAVEPQDAGAEWALGTDALDQGHTMPRGRTHSFTLVDGEQLYVKGSGVLTVTVT